MRGTDEGIARVEAVGRRYSPADAMACGWEAPGTPPVPGQNLKVRRCARQGSQVRASLWVRTNMQEVIA